jgi:hypothetical protein
MKTTVLGVLTIIVAVGSAAVSLLKTGTFDFATTAASVTAGLGLIKAKDAPAKPRESGIVRLAPFAFFASLLVALSTLTSCVSMTDAKGVTTRAPDRGLIDRGIEAGFRLVDRFFPKPEPVPPVAVPVVTPAK